MKIILTIIILLFMINPDSTDLTVTITNLKEDTGVVRLAIFDKSSAFPDKAHQAYDKVIAQVQGGKATAVFKNIKPGKYAISAFHDANNDGVINKNAFGIPKEGYGFSNDAMGSFGPPSFSAASFEVDENKNTHSFKLRH
ncbi:DUF2141 domain-containing protein [Anditalea andensis]|uniref:DUF2141 domain-containing protein n=1 Tax=Anditalea andensis TaxID=1048983 RepID=A0A074KXX7_9BACT|nr:DUF2141 domain-containing protein [Anditalea andensis]KEO72458.1 hypothetical protein EL17_17105 [Anditalea andensis]